MVVRGGGFCTAVQVPFDNVTLAADVGVHSSTVISFHISFPAVGYSKFYCTVESTRFWEGGKDDT